MSGLPSAAVAYKLSYNLSPIILTGGSAGLIPGRMLPLLAVTESLNFVTGLLGSADIDLDNFFAVFDPVSGSKLIDQQYATYPFANQKVAANSGIAQPLRISLKMTCPAKGPAGALAKIAILNALKATLDNHINNGGTFNVVTPAYIYTNCLLLDLTDVTTNVKQPQSEWVWNFFQPLLTQDQADAAQNTMMSRISGGLPSDGSLSGFGLTTGAPPSLATSAIAPVASNLSGTSLAGRLAEGSLAP